MAEKRAFLLTGIVVSSLLVLYSVVRLLGPAFALLRVFGLVCRSGLPNLRTLRDLLETPSPATAAALFFLSAGIGSLVFFFRLWPASPPPLPRQSAE